MVLGKNHVISCSTSYVESVNTIWCKMHVSEGISVSQYVLNEIRDNRGVGVTHSFGKKRDFDPFSTISVLISSCLFIKK